jgi:cell division protease FtsH
MAQARDYSESTAQLIDAEIRALVEGAHNEAYQALTLNRGILDALAKELMERETLQQEDIARIFAKVKKLPVRKTWLSNSKRPVSTKAPIAIPPRAVTAEAEVAAKPVRKVVAKKPAAKKPAAPKAAAKPAAKKPAPKGKNQ